MDRDMLKPFIDKVVDLTELLGEDYIEELYLEKDKKFEENGCYNIYAYTNDGVLEIVTGLYYNEVDYALKVLIYELDEAKKKMENSEE